MNPTPSRAVKRYDSGFHVKHEDCATDIQNYFEKEGHLFQPEQICQIIAKHFPDTEKVTDQEIYWIEQAVDISVQAGNKQVGTYVWPAIEKLKKQLGLA